MKKTGNRLFAILMTVCMLAGLMPTASAGSWWNPDSIDVTTEEELINAIEQSGADSNPEIVLAQDIKLTSTLGIPENVNVTINLYGYQISCAAEDGISTAIRVDNGATLSVYGSGNCIFFTGSSSQPLVGVQLDGGTLIFSDVDMAVYNAGSGAVYGVKSNSPTSRVNLSCGSRIRVQSGIGDAYSVYMENNTSTKTSGEDPYGSSISLSALFTDTAVLHAVSGSDASQAAVYMTAGDTELPEIYLESTYVIGQVKTDGGYEGATAINTGKGVTVNIDDGPENAWISSFVYGDMMVAEKGTAGTGIAGGYFSEDPGPLLRTDRDTEPAEEYIYVDYEDGSQELTGFIYHVLPAGSVARIGVDYYTSLKAAFEDSYNTDEISLLKDVTLETDVTITGSNSTTATAKRLRLNLNGHSLTGSGGALIVGDGSYLALTIRDNGAVQSPCSVPIKVAENSYLTIQSGTFDVWPTYVPGTDANKHIFVTGGSFLKTGISRDDLRSYAVGLTVRETANDKYWNVSQGDKPVIVAIGENVTSYDNATQAFEAINTAAEKYTADQPLKAIMSINGPAELTKDTVLNANADLTMVYSYYYNKHFITSPEGSRYTLTIDGATITSGDTAYTPYALLLDNADLVVNSGIIVGQTGNSSKKDSIYAVKVTSGSVTINGGQIIADGKRDYEDRDPIINMDDTEPVTSLCLRYEHNGTTYTAAIWDNAAYGVTVEGGTLTIRDPADILAVGSYTVGATVNKAGDRLTMTGGRVSSLAFCHPGISKQFPIRDYYQYAYGVRAESGKDMVIKVSGGEIQAKGSFSYAVSNNSSLGSLAMVSGGTVNAEGTYKVIGVRCSQAYITGGEIRALCQTGLDSGWRSHYNAVGVLMEWPYTSSTVDGVEYFPTVSDATIDVTALNDGEACGLLFKGFYEWRDYDFNTGEVTTIVGTPEITVEDCKVSASAEDSFSCAVNNDGGYSTAIKGGEYTSICENGFADCVCAYYTSDLTIEDGTFTVQANSQGGTSAYSNETYAATCVYNQSNGKTVITGGKFLILNENGDTEESGESVEEGPAPLFRLLRAHNPKQMRYNDENGDYEDSGKSILTVSGGLFSDKVCLTNDVVAKGYQVIPSGDSTYPWTVGKETYDVIIDDTITGGAISAEPMTASEGTTVTITVTPDQGKTVEEVTVTDGNNNPAKVTPNDDGTYTFTMPGSSVTIHATFRDVDKTTPSSGGGSVRTNAIVIDDAITGGTVTTDRKSVRKGAKVTFTVTPDEGNTVDKVTVTDKNGKDVDVTDNGDGTYTFTMPGTPVTIGATFLKSSQPEPPSGDYSACGKDDKCPICKFSDAQPDAWYHDGVHYALDAGIMQGVSEDSFAPNNTTTRAMIVTMLWRMEGGPAAQASGFDDTESGSWYADAVNWAAAEAIVEGYDAATFGPQDPVTREQIAAILYRYAQYKGADVSVGESTNILSYNDVFTLSQWAYPSMQWAVGAQLIQGKGDDSTLAPRDNATRAEVATLLLRFEAAMEHE